MRGDPRERLARCAGSGSDPTNIRSEARTFRGADPATGLPRRSRACAAAASRPAPSFRSSPPSLPCSWAWSSSARGARAAHRPLVRPPRAPRRRLLVRSQPDRDRQPAAVHVVRPAAPADARSRLRAAPRLLRLSLRHRLRRLEGLVLPRPRTTRSGCLWPLVLAAFIGGADLRDLARARRRSLRVLGAVVLFTAVAYVFTPAHRRRRAGPADRLRVERPVPGAGRSDRARAAADACRALRDTETGRDVHPRARSRSSSRATAVDLVQWQQGHVKGAIAAGVGVLFGFRGHPALAGAIAAIARGQPAAKRGPLAVGRRASRRSVAIGRPRAPAGGNSATTSSTATRTSARNLKLADAVRWARDLRDANVAVSGVRGVFNQFPFYGDGPLQPRPVAGDARVPTAPTSGSRRASSGARRLPTADTRTSSPPTTRSTPAS